MEGEGESYRDKLAKRLADMKEARQPKPKKRKPNWKKDTVDIHVDKEGTLEEHSARAAAKTTAALTQILAKQQEAEKRQSKANFIPPPPDDLEAPEPPKENKTSSNATNKDKDTEREPKERRKRKSSSSSGNAETDPELAPITASVCTERFSDFGGIAKELEEIRRLIEFPLRYPQVFEHLGADPPAGILLHGPPGCGKSRLAAATAGELGVPFFKISAPEIVAGVSGESEAKIRQLFQTAKAEAPCLIFMDEVDAIAGKRESAQREMERRIVAQMLTCMDELGQLWREEKRICIVLAATNRPDSLDSALRRAGRFDREIPMGIPTLEGRIEILKVMTDRLRKTGDFDLEAIAFKCPGFVGADLHAVTKEACGVALKRIFNVIYGAAMEEKKKEDDDPQDETAKAEDDGNLPPIKLDEDEELDGNAAESPMDGEGNNAPNDTNGTAEPEKVEPPKPVGITPLQSPDSLPTVDVTPAMMEEFYITMDDFNEAIPHVQPSAMREGFTTVPSVTWDDVGALEEVKTELINNISKPILKPEIFQAMGCLSNPTGVMLYGPPGCGKTLVAKAIANESGANFISIKGPELLNKYMGETEKSVRTVFARAQASAPCILFFDELDALAPKRGMESGNQAAERVVNQLLTELDGVTGRKQVYVIGASNRIDMIDPAMLRPGRLDKLLFVPLPDGPKRVAILRTVARKTPLAPGINVDDYALDPRCEGFSGADMAALMREAALAAVTQFFNECDRDELTKEQTAQKATPVVTKDHLEAAISKVKPSVTEKERLRYDRMRKERQNVKPAS